MKKLLFLFLIILISCVDDKEFEVPNTDSSILQTARANTNIKALQNAWNQNYASSSQQVYTFPITQEAVYIEGFVISSDYGGNFYKKLIIQDKAENPSAGIEVRIDKPALYSFFEVGRKVLVKLDGLSITYEDGKNNDPSDNFHGRYVLGQLNQGDIVGVSTSNFEKHIQRTLIVEKIIPKKLSISEFEEKYVNTYVLLDKIQFEKNELKKTFAGEYSDEYDGLRILKSCSEDLNVLLQTSTYSDFKSHIIPSGLGFVQGVLSKNYTADYFVFIINNPNDIIFENQRDCDPFYLNCSAIQEEGNTILFEEDFENTDFENLKGLGWINQNINNHVKTYELDDKLGNSYMELSAYNSDESPMEVWLITPEIDISTFTNKSLSFETLSGYYNGKVLNIYVTTDFNGDIKNANWQELQVILAEGPKSGYGKNFVKSGQVDLSCLSGKIRVAFRYLGVDGSLTSTMRIDNIRIVGDR